MRLLVFGQTGQVATELKAQAGVTTLGLDQADLGDPETCKAAIRAHEPNAVINAAAYTAVDKAESEEALATKVNGEAPGVMARECAALGIPFVHISTDYVFDGSGSGPVDTHTMPNPLNAYGRSKLAGEDRVRDAGGDYAILRTSWVFSAHGSNFVKTMMRLSETRDALDIVSDQIGGPTPAHAIALACMTIADALREHPEKRGTYHFAGTPTVSWKQFAEAIFDTAGRPVTVRGIPTSDYPTPAQRPINSRLDCDETTRVFGIEMPDWRPAIRQIVAQ